MYMYTPRPKLLRKENDYICNLLFKLFIILIDVHIKHNIRYIKNKQNKYIIKYINIIQIQINTNKIH